MPVLPAIPVPQSQAARPSVSPPSSARPTPRSQTNQSDEKKIAFGDLIIPKKAVYVGEVVPIELRFYFDASYPVRLPDRPSFSGDGFTVMRFSKPIEKQQEVDGRVYNVVIFQTAISAAKSGTLEIPPASMESQIQLPGRGPSGMDDFFGGFFGNMMSSGDIRQIDRANAIGETGCQTPAERRPARGFQRRDRAVFSAGIRRAEAGCGRRSDFFDGHSVRARKL